MIRGLGTDIIEVDRMAEKIARVGFKEQIFSAAEIVYCEQQARPAQHYAARFAAKEAFLKATGQGLLLTLDLSCIEIVKNEAGQPAIQLHGNLREQARKHGWNHIHVSISHLETVACAMVILES